MNDALRFTVRYFDGWIMAQVEEAAGAISQGRTCEEARENITDALRLMLKPEPGESTDPDGEPLELPLVSSGAGARERHLRRPGTEAVDSRSGRTPVSGSAETMRSPLLIAAVAVVVAVVLALIGEALSFGDGAYLAAPVMGMLVVSLIDRDRFWAADPRRTGSPR